MFLNIIKTIIIGIIEGITEWLPISSTGHMILANEFIKLDVSSEFWKMFEVVIQLGAIMAVVVIIIILTFFLRIVNVDGRSMMNTLLDNDKVIVTNFMYTPKDNDIVVISHAKEYDKPIIKRVIATEGQRLKIDFENQKVYVDGTLIDEPYVSSELKEGNTEIPSVIPKGKVFVMGDNRLDSLDSRYSEIGLIDEENIIGKAQFVILPITRIQYLY